MTPENFSKKLAQKAAELQQFLQSKLPRYVGKTAVDFFQENFRKGGWCDGGLKRWQPPKRFNERGNAASQYGPLLSRQNELMKRACIAVFTNEYENNFSYLLDFRAQNILHASSIRPFKKNF